MTEEEAKTKWCPHAHPAASASVVPHANRFSDKSDLPAGSRCIGSACMAWRWEYPDPDEIGEDGMFVESASTGRYPGEETSWKSPAHGFCGLAGAPQ